MFPCTKFQLIRRFWDQTCSKNVSDKNFGKINIKFEMRIQLLRPNLPNKDFRVEY